MTEREMADQTTQERGPGRPREPEVDARILSAAFQLMARSGYVRMSMDAVALEAGVTKPTIYRRYPGKLQLALAAIAACCGAHSSAPAGSTREALITEIGRVRRALGQPHALSLIGTMLAEERETPELLASFRDQQLAPRRRAVQAILDRAGERGEFRPGADLHVAGAMLLGACFAQGLAGGPLPADWVERVVDAALAGLAAA
ncbi:MAG TPA: TetR/AcrR family transcriptional regulator [Herpetosiphonaceae bacterium]|nr:TetR/AcrR family transcriptional regulator [Herpetosiphonaceae bacterium]